MRRAWLCEQILPGDERLAVERHLREFDRLTDDLKVIERDLAQSALADEDRATRLMTIPGINMVVALALIAAIESQHPGPTAQSLGLRWAYKDLIDHNQLRHDPTLAVLAGKLVARRRDCAPLAGKSTLNRLKLGGAALPRYHRIACDGTKIEALFVDLFLEAHRAPPKQIMLDLHAIDDPLHGDQEGARLIAAITTATPICCCTSFTGRICWRPNSGPPTSMPLPARSSRWRPLSRRFAPAGPQCASAARRFGVCAVGMW